MLARMGLAEAADPKEEGGGHQKRDQLTALERPNHEVHQRVQDPRDLVIHLLGPAGIEQNCS